MLFTKLLEIISLNTTTHSSCTPTTTTIFASGNSRPSLLRKLKNLCFSWPSQRYLINRCWMAGGALPLPESFGDYVELVVLILLYGLLLVLLPIINFVWLAIRFSCFVFFWVYQQVFVVVFYLVSFSVWCAIKLVALLGFVFTNLVAKGLVGLFLLGYDFLTLVAKALFWFFHWFFFNTWLDSLSLTLWIAVLYLVWTASHWVSQGIYSRVRRLSAKLLRQIFRPWRVSFTGYFSRLLAYVFQLSLIGMVLVFYPIFLVVAEFCQTLWSPLLSNLSSVALVQVFSNSILVVGLLTFALAVYNVIASTLLFMLFKGLYWSSNLPMLGFYVAAQWRLLVSGLVGFHFRLLFVLYFFLIALGPLVDVLLGMVLEMAIWYQGLYFFMFTTVPHYFVVLAFFPGRLLYGAETFLADILAGPSSLSSFLASYAQITLLIQDFLLGLKVDYPIFPVIYGTNFLLRFLQSGLTVFVFMLSALALFLSLVLWSVLRFWLVFRPAFLLWQLKRDLARAKDYSVVKESFYFRPGKAESLLPAMAGEPENEKISRGLTLDPRQLLSPEFVAAAQGGLSSDRKLLSHFYNHPFYYSPQDYLAHLFRFFRDRSLWFYRYYGLSVRPANGGAEFYPIFESSKRNGLNLAAFEKKPLWVRFGLAARLLWFMFSWLRFLFLILFVFVAYLPFVFWSLLVRVLGVLLKLLWGLSNKENYEVKVSFGKNLISKLLSYLTWDYQAFIIKSVWGYFLLVVDYLKNFFVDLGRKGRKSLYAATEVPGENSDELFLRLLTKKLELEYRLDEYTTQHSRFIFGLFCLAMAILCLIFHREVQEDFYRFADFFRNDLVDLTKKYLDFFIRWLHKLLSYLKSLGK